MLQETAIEPRTLELLKRIQKDDIFNIFHLAGGTGLAVQLGHRLSVDLDLFSVEKFDVHSYLEYLIQNYGFKPDYFSRNTIKGSIDNVKVDFIAHVYPLVGNIIETEQIRIYTINDIAAMKVNAISLSGTRSKDFVDLYFLLKKYNIGEILGFYEKKYNEHNKFHALRSLNYFNDVQLSDWPVLLTEKDLTWKIVERIINKSCIDYTKTLNK